jgi:hypothetical protein
MNTELQDYLNGICCAEVTPTLPYNFDMESSSWADAGITDKATFESALGVTCGAFVMTGGRIEAEILTVSSPTLGLRSFYINKVNYITVPGITVIILSNNEIVDFNPTKPLNSNLEALILDVNLMEKFNPTIPMPVSLTALKLDSNQMTTAGYTASETWATAQPAFTSTCLIQIRGNIDSASGTNLETILLTKNTTVVAV